MAQEVSELRQRPPEAFREIFPVCDYLVLHPGFSESAEIS